MARALRVRVRVHLGQHELDARRVGVASARRGQQLVERGLIRARARARARVRQLGSGLG